MNAANTANAVATSFYIPRVCKRWMPHDIQATINTAYQGGPQVIRVDIVPIVRPETADKRESFVERLDKENHSVFVYFDREINYSSWGNGIKGGKQTRIYTGCIMTPIANAPGRETKFPLDGGKSFNEYWVLIPNNPRSVIPYTSKTPIALEQELNALKEQIYKIDDLALFNKELEIWEYDWNCVQFHKALVADEPEDVCQHEFDKIYCAWLSIHQVAANIQHLANRLAKPATATATATATIDAYPKLATNKLATNKLATVRA
jgi:hypothetical protein